MKKQLLLIASLFVSAGFVTAQNIQIKDASSNIINGQTYIKAGSSGDAVIQVDDIDVYNTTGSAMSVKMKRYEMNVQTGTGNSYCWSICTTEAAAGTYPMWNAGPVQNINAGAYFDSFTADHYPHGVAGTNVYRYVWYDYSNPNDSAYLDIQFDVVLGTENLTADDYVMSVYPNPAASFINFNVNGNNQKNVKIRISDALGKTVKSIEVPENNGVVKVNVTDFNPGVYFYTLEVNRKAIATRRIMVTR